MALESSWTLPDFHIQRLSMLRHLKEVGESSRYESFMKFTPYSSASGVAKRLATKAVNVTIANVGAPGSDE